MALITCKDCKQKFSDDVDKCIHCGATRTPSIMKAFGIAVVASICYLVWHGISEKAEQKIEEYSQIQQVKLKRERQETWQNEQNSLDEKKSIMSQVKLQFKGFNSYGTLIANFTIENQSNFSIKDIQITCINSGNSGTEIDNNTITIYEIISGKQSKNIDNLRVGLINPQVTSVQCSITDLKVI